MKLVSFLVLSALSFGGFIVLGWNSSQLPFSIPEKAVQGKQIWQKYNCISCHSLFGNGGYNGGDLTHILQKRSSQELTDYLVDPPIMRPHHKRLHVNVSNNEAQLLVDYFRLLDQIPTLGWPPNALESEAEL